MNYRRRKAEARRASLPARVALTPEQRREREREYRRQYDAKYPGRRREAQRRWEEKKRSGELINGVISARASWNPAYRAWMGMRNRCRNQNNKSYAIYGGRGIRVCERWDRSFDAFLADVGERPTERHSLERIDVNGNYEPGNIRWATAKEQKANQRLSAPRVAAVLDRMKAASDDLLERAVLDRVRKELLGA